MCFRHDDRNPYEFRWFGGRNIFYFYRNDDFQATEVPLVMVRHARERWWNERANQPGTPAQMREVLKHLPRGSEMQEVIIIIL